MHELALDNRKLKELIKKCRHFSIKPLDLPSYERGIKQNQNVRELLSELVDAAVQDLLALSSDEKKSLVKSFPPAIGMFSDLDTSQNDEKELRRIAVYYIVAELHRSNFSFKAIVNENIDNSTVFQIFPELKERLDKDNLLFIDGELIMHDYGIEYKDYIIQYHRFLRSRYLSYSNSGFLGRWITYYQKTQSFNQFRIAIDHHSTLKSKEEYDQILEFDTWYGPAFDPEKLDDPNYVGLTLLGRNKNSLFEHEYKLHRTEFFWSFRDGIKTFETEEISDDGQWYDCYYFNKYVHSERNITQKVTRHVDGAVKVYFKTDYANRKSANLPNKDSYTKIKLWRIDGNVDLENWINLITFFYKGNEMVYEYFDPVGFEDKFELRVRDFEAWKKQQES
ncbi:hypothetical protein LC607_15750 [Nostoc sp. CHAB 5824]|nr:hypothetical protein [Nostoc sp. CHAB 5824]